MTTTDWEAYFAACDFPHNPFDHGAAADFYEEMGEGEPALEHRRKAAFWAWVRQLDVRPCHYGGRWAWQGPRNWKFRSEGILSALPEHVFLALPNDRNATTSREALDIGLVMTWDSQAGAWDALFQAWLATRRGDLSLVEEVP